MKPSTELILMMRPDRLSRMAGSTCSIETGIVDEDVDGAGAPDNVGDGRAHASIGGDIELQHRHALRTRPAFGMPAGAKDAIAALRQQRGGGKTDS